MEDVRMGMWVEQFNASSGVQYSLAFCGISLIEVVSASLVMVG